MQLGRGLPLSLPQYNLRRRLKCSLQATHLSVFSARRSSKVYISNIAHSGRLAMRQLVCSRCILPPRSPPGPIRVSHTRRPRPISMSWCSQRDSGPSYPLHASSLGTCWAITFFSWFHILCTLFRGCGLFFLLTRGVVAGSHLCRRLC
jgi:hypothetical protein